MMKKEIYFGVAVLVLSIVLAAGAHAVVQKNDLSITFIGQDPSLAVPGKYVDLTFNVNGGQFYSSQDVTFQIVPQFPFSTPPGENPVKTLGDIQAIGTGSKDNTILFQVRLLVDGKAPDGDNELQYQYSIGGSTFTKKLNISVSNVRTDFDVIVQEISGDSASLGIVNTGKNDAKSVVVKILPSGNFDTTSVDSSILGNLASGDFTVTTFNLVPKANEKSALNLLVSYTDTQGARHDLTKSVELQLNPAAAAQQAAAAQKSGGLPIVTIILILIIIALVYQAFFKKK